MLGDRLGDGHLIGRKRSPLVDDDDDVLPTRHHGRHEDVAMSRVNGVVASGAAVGSAAAGARRIRMMMMMMVTPVRFVRFVVVEVVRRILDVQALHRDKVLPLDQRIAFQVAHEDVRQIASRREEGLVDGGGRRNQVARLSRGDVRSPRLRPGHIDAAPQSTAVLRRVLRSDDSEGGETRIELTGSIPQVRRVEFLDGGGGKRREGKTRRG